MDRARLRQGFAEQVEADKYLAGKDAVSANPAKSFVRVSGITGFVIDCGRFPAQPGRLFTMDTPQRTLGRAFRGAGPDGAIQAGLEELVSTYLAKDFKGGQGLLQIERLLLDIGYKPGIVAAIKHKCGGATMMLSKGLGIRAGSRLMSSYARRGACTPPRRPRAGRWARR